MQRMVHSCFEVLDARNRLLSKLAAANDAQKKASAKQQAVADIADPVAKEKEKVCYFVFFSNGF